MTTYDQVAWARRLKVKHLESFMVLDDAGTLTINWQGQRCEASYALPERDKAVNYERASLVCRPSPVNLP